MKFSNYNTSRFEQQRVNEANEDAIMCLVLDCTFDRSTFVTGLIEFIFFRLYRYVDGKIVDQVYIPPLPYDNWVALQVGNVHRCSLDDNVSVFSNEQPPHVREKESSLSIVRIGISVSKLMMNPMIPDPFAQMVLKSNY